MASRAADLIAPGIYSAATAL